MASSEPRPGRALRDVDAPVVRVDDLAHNSQASRPRRLGVKNGLKIRSVRSAGTPSPLYQLRRRRPVTTWRRAQVLFRMRDRGGDRHRAGARPRFEAVIHNS